ncbi:ribosome biogenesis protein SLX9 homolog isoform X2 [Narcine bancroftii]|uniref:ribosome biogenesis protein SLX9 homolog isoform X2 n=1 Tax=Narcine bancroftii TaxID=1343680 RepID=UPI0038312A00
MLLDPLNCFSGLCPSTEYLEPHQAGSSPRSRNSCQRFPSPAVEPEGFRGRTGGRTCAALDNMVGKAKRSRFRLHSAAVKLTGQARVESEPPQGPASTRPPFPGDGRKRLEEETDHLSTSLFAGTKIDPKLLVRKLDSEDCKTVVSSKKGDKVQIPKKEKIKQRRERWLQKIEMIKLATEKKKAQEKRKSTPVVGDMQPLSDALPELKDLIGASNSSMTNKLKSNEKKKPEKIQYRRMKQAQKRKLVYKRTKT